MRLRVLSDLHLEFQDWHPPPHPADVVILAGDIHVGSAGIEWARRAFGAAPIVYVAGNHEYFHGELRGVQKALRVAARDCAVHFIDF
ncbi:MAG: metallophosphoesterase, partial [Steroidobacteraceae bacterium]|nr:metallophosphoesterase [Steroidobacteraceae bacterium]MDW8258291.1 metallophosphoesterase [Gammaproteobacteria bacterium]